MKNIKNNLMIIAQEIIDERLLDAKTKVLEIEENLFKDTTYVALLNKKGDLTIKIAEKINKGETDLASLYEELSKNEIDIINVMASHNVTPNMLVPNYTCKICNDTGYTNGEKCVCLKKVYNELLLRESNIDYEKYPDLENLNTSVYDGKNVLKLIDTLKKVSEKFPSTNINTIIMNGKCGVGKTYISKSFAKTLASKDFTTLYLTSFGFNNLLLKLHTSDFNEKSEILNQLLQADLLIIDDLGCEPIYKNVTIEYFYSIINQRLDSKCLTLITTNLTKDEILARYNERIYSRLFHKEKTLTMTLDGSSLR